MEGKQINRVEARGARQSNMELLRIVSMAMILLLHVDGASVGLPYADGLATLADPRNVWRLAVESFAIIGVNCFTLISGYFGIRLKFRSILSFLFQCVFYAVAMYLIAAFYRIVPFSWSVWFEQFLVLTHTDLWYIPAYFILMLLAPFLNEGCERLSKKAFSMILLVFVLFNVWAGWWWKGAFNPTGYTAIQLVMMYLIGRYIKLYRVLAEVKRGIWTALYLIFTLGILASALWLQGRAFAYNSPAVIAASVAFFLIFRSMSFASWTVNFVARSSFAVYLIHKAPAIWVGVMKPGVVALWRSSSLALFSLYALLIVIGVFLIAILFDTLRRRLFRLFGL